MGMNQIVHVAYGFSVPPEQIDGFLEKLVHVFEQEKTLIGGDLDDFKAAPSMLHLNKDHKWSNISFSSSYDENSGVPILVVYDSDWSQRVSSRYETVLPVVLKNPADYEGALPEFLSFAGIPETSLSWVFYVIVN